jgi:hypothetical protein
MTPSNMFLLEFNHPGVQEGYQNKPHGMELIRSFVPFHSSIIEVHIQGENDFLSHFIASTKPFTPTVGGIKKEGLKMVKNIIQQDILMIGKIFRRKILIDCPCDHVFLSCSSDPDTLLILICRILSH